MSAEHGPRPAWHAPQDSTVRAAHRPVEQAPQPEHRQPCVPDGFRFRPRLRRTTGALAEVVSPAHGRDPAARGLGPALQPRRVLMTADAVGGVWDYSLQLAAALGPHGTEVTLATMGPRPSGAQRAAAAAIRSLTLVESDYPLEWMDIPWDGIARAGAWLRYLETAIDPDLVHLNGYVHAALPWRAPTLVAAHSCVCSWWMAVHGCEAPASWDRYRRAVRSGLFAADAVVAPSRAMLAAVAAHYGPVAGSVIPNGRDAQGGACVPKEQLVLAAGRLWDAAKNISTLAAIAGRLPWRVAIAGDLEAPSGAGVTPPPGVLALGRLSSSELRGWLDRASIYALPARYEPFGLSVLEAAHARAALVLGDIPSLREHWDGAAVFVPPSDADALHASIRSLIDDDERRAELGRRAFARGRELNVGRMAAGYRQLYGALLEAGGRRATKRGGPCGS